MRDSASRAEVSAARQSCLESVRALISRHGWTLLSDQELADLALAPEQPEGAPDGMAQRVTYHYAIALYAACRQPEDVDRRNRAFQDLFHYLYRVAYNRWPDIAQDVAQRALPLVYEQLDRCQYPGAFLQFALFKLRQAATDLRRAAGRDVSLDQVGERDLAGDLGLLVAPILRRECLEALLDAIKRLPAAQQQTIAMKFLEGLSDEEIGTRLDLKVNTVRVQRHRGL
jgi:RNA polymerase sigma factor (sigma-70 family)